MVVERWCNSYFFVESTRKISTTEILNKVFKSCEYDTIATKIAQVLKFLTDVPLNGQINANFWFETDLILSWKIYIALKSVVQIGKTALKNEFMPWYLEHEK